MIVAPINIETAIEAHSVLIVVIEKENLYRMKQGDPITLESGSRGGNLMTSVKFPQNLSLLIAYSEDDPQLYMLAKNKDLLGLLKHLERNRKWVPGVDGVTF